MNVYIKDYEELEMPILVRTVKQRDAKILAAYLSLSKKKQRFWRAQIENCYYDKVDWQMVQDPMTKTDLRHGCKLHFGKHKGLTYEEVVHLDEGYAHWLLDKDIMTEQDRRYMGWLIHLKRTMAMELKAIENLEN